MPIQKRYMWNILLLLAVVISGWLLVRSHYQITPRMNLHRGEPDMFMKNVVATEFNDNGKPRYTLITPKLIHYSQFDTTYFTTPYIINYSPTGAPWHIRAKYGKKSKQDGERQILLWDHVKVQRPQSPDNAKTTMLTSILTVYPNQSLATTNAPVTAIQPDITIKGVGMRAYFKSKQIKLLSKVEANYAPTTKQ